ncbi:MAG: eCIS core domain-containing protein, partial [Myxococcales bacterium]
GQRKIDGLLRDRKAHAAGLELMALGSRCEQIDGAIREAKALAEENDESRREIAFYEEWHGRSRATLHARIADTEGLGAETAISGFAIAEATHADVFANTRAIYAVRTKVRSFGAALRDPSAAGPVRKVLEEARRAKTDLGALRAKYREDEAALRFLAPGPQDELIDEPLSKLEEAAAAPEAEPAPKDARPVPKEPVEEGLPAIVEYGRKAVTLGKRVDSGLERIEKTVGTGIRAGDKVESGLRKLAGFAGRLGGILGEDTALGRLAQKVGSGLEKGEEKLHGALEVARSGEEVLGEGHDLLHRALEAAGEEDVAEPAARREPRDPVAELIDAVLGGEGGRLHADRGAERGPQDGSDVQEIDSVAADTWIGSGEGAKIFSDVFAGFLPAEGAAAVRHGGRADGAGARGRKPAAEGKPGFFAGLFEHLEGFADRIGGLAKKGGGALGKGMHYLELGMHGLGEVERAARKVQGFAGKAEKFLGDLGLDRLAGFAAKAGGAAEWVEDSAEVVQGAAKKADRFMGKGKKVAGEVEHGAHAAAGFFDEAAHGGAGELLSVFQASRAGPAIEGRRTPDKVALAPILDEPRRLDLTTLSRMESFLGDDFSGVRIHTGPGAAEVTRRFNADAVTVRDHVFFAPGRFNPSSGEGQQLIAHELTHVLQQGRRNLDVRTAESEALHAERTYGRAPAMETLNLSRPPPDFRLEADGATAPAGVHPAKRTRSRGHEATAKDTPPDGEEFLEQVSGRVYELLMDELEQAFESR